MRTLVMSALLLLAARVSTAQATNCDGSPLEYAISAAGRSQVDHVKPTTLPARSIVMDATGGTICDRMVYGSRDVVAFEVANINPFLFKYRVTVKGVVTVETAPLEFFSGAFGYALPKAGGGAQAAGLAEEMTKENNVCGTPTPDQILALEGAYRAVARDSTRIAAKLDTAGASLRSLDDAVKLSRVTIDDAASRAGDVYAAAKSAVTSAKNVDSQLRDLELPKLLVQATKSYAVFSDLLDRAKKDYAACDYVKELVDESKLLAAGMADLKTQVATIGDRQAAADRQRASTEAAIMDPHNFYSVTILGPYDAPQVDSIKTERKATAAEDKE
ncbi:MAG: hypothetical protein ABI625_24350, partial [bacterium]